MREFGESGSSGGRRDAKPAGTRHVALSARATTPRCPKASSSTLQAPLQHNPSLSRFSPPYTSNHAPDAVALTLRIVQSLPRPLAHAFSIASPVTLAAPFRHAAFSIPRTPTPRSDRYSRRNGRGRSYSRSGSRSPTPDRGPRRFNRRSYSRSGSRGSRDKSPPRSSKIVVEKLTKNVNEDHLREIFGTYGRIQDLDMPINRQFMTNRGTAYIMYSDPAAAEAAIAHMHEAQLDEVLPPVDPMEVVLQAATVPRRLAVVAGALFHLADTEDRAAEEVVDVVLKEQKPEEEQESVILIAIPIQEPPAEERRSWGRGWWKLQG
ncbi:hypothetical protein GTA08_BOTSDO05584 [Botryosphaeria dothidea]|uniref:RRM domain-containing protein n=1 Tax=Botryosphaeria dothidea TaxID=55169 RepID=A0A8H4N227_9PEZI|nr:hypothetical protein GTA08_BOTSDO05584 [Botryosphaeria dothidea]